MKAKKLAIIAITLIIVTSVGCDEAAMVDDLILDGLTEEGDGTVKLADLKVEQSTVAPTNPNLDREKLLNFPWDKATEEEMAEYWEVVRGLAVNVNVLDIATGNPEPFVTEVAVGECVEIRNSDTASHIFRCPPWGEAITIPSGSSRGVVVTELSGLKDGGVNYGRDDEPVGIFLLNLELPEHVHFRVVEFITPDGNGPGVEGVTVTHLAGSTEKEKETFQDGSISLEGDLPLTIRLEKEGYFTTEVTVLEKGEVIVLPGHKRNISFRVVEPLLPETGLYHPNWPRDFTQNGPGIERVTVTPLEGSDEGIKETNQNGEVSFFGTPPLKVRLEKEGYITIETVVLKEEIIFPNEWPPELDIVVEQLELTEAINSGQLILSWGIENTGAYFYDCSFIHITKDHDRRNAVWALTHEAMHARQAIESNAGCGSLLKAWPPSKEGQAWVVALEKDLKEHGPIPSYGFDDRVQADKDNIQLVVCQHSNAG